MPGGAKKKSKKNPAIKKKTKKLLSRSNRVSGYLLGINEYAKALANPWNARNVKIPDFLCTPTSCFTVVQRATLSVSSAGACCAMYWCQPIFQGSDTNVSFDQQGLWLSTSSSVPNDLLLNSVAASHYGELLPFPQSEEIANVYSSTRITSAGLLMEYTGTALDNKGLFTAAFIPPEKIFEFYFQQPGGLEGFNVNDLQTELVSTTQAVNQGSISVTYHPVSQRGFDLRDTFAEFGAAGTAVARDLLAYEPDNTITGIRAGSTAGFGDMNYNQVLILAGTGMTADSNVEVTLIVNYEGIPYTNQFSVAAPSPSPVDPVKLSQGLNAVPTALVGSGSDMLHMTPARVQANLGESGIPAPVSVGSAPPIQQGPLQGGDISAMNSGSGGGGKSSKNFGDFLMDDVVPFAQKYGGSILSGLAALL